MTEEEYRELMVSLEQEPRTLSFFEAMEVRFWKDIDAMRDEDGVVQKPEYMSPPPLTCEERNA